MPPNTYKGVPFEKIRIEAIHWSDEAEEHIQTRTDRKGPGEVNIEPTWATEAALDKHRLVSYKPGKSALDGSFQIVGFSPTADRMIQVWVYSDDPTSEVWEGASAAIAKRKDRKKYEEAMQ